MSGHAGAQVSDTKAGEGLQRACCFATARIPAYKCLALPPVLVPDARVAPPTPPGKKRVIWAVSVLSGPLDVMVAHHTVGPRVPERCSFRAILSAGGAQYRLRGRRRPRAVQVIGQFRVPRCTFGFVVLSGLHRFCVFRFLRSPPWATNFTLSLIHI